MLVKFLLDTRGTNYLQLRFSNVFVWTRIASLFGHIHKHDFPGIPTSIRENCELFRCFWGCGTFLSNFQYDLLGKTLQDHKFESIAQEADACFAYNHDRKSYFGFQTGSNPPKLIGSSESTPTIGIKRWVWSKICIQGMPKKVSFTNEKVSIKKNVTI